MDTAPRSHPLPAACPADRRLTAYLRRPDTAFWRELFTPAPGSTAHDQSRRARLARYALGMAVVATLPYVGFSLWLGPRDFLPVVLLNVLAVLGYGLGLWAASLGANRAARLWLLVTLEGQLAALAWLTGSALGVVSFTPVAAALSRVLFLPSERAARAVFTWFPLLVLVASLALPQDSLVDFSIAPAWLLPLARAGNTLFAALMILLLLGVFDREVLKSEAELVDERNRSDRLLHVVLPRPIAEQLRVREGAIADRHDGVTVLFADLAGFTPWAAQRDPGEVIALLEQVFARFDLLVAAAGAEKIKTIGDAYMAVAGVPAARPDHAAVMAGLALAFRAEVARLRAETGVPLDVRIGLHSGPVIAGVIGSLRFSYDIWGDTVNTASRMESHGEPGRIQLTAETRAALGEAFATAPRGVIEVKGKGPLPTWWLLERRAG
ncbi:MAG TPA: adenylate/guanylate cyclase domain-containing protein [Moraxellaceae bacterium]|nr:adenylate/guanylate cyclase domain-containing protein [Moraxellaceae bacterium]